MLCLCTFFVFVVQFSRFACRVNRSFSIISKPFHFVKYFFEISQKNFFSASWFEPAAFCAACLLYPTRSALSSTFSKILKILFSAFQLDPPLLRWSYSLADSALFVNTFFDKNSGFSVCFRSVHISFFFRRRSARFSSFYNIYTIYKQKKIQPRRKSARLY